MKKDDRNFTLGVITYVLIGFLTFGYYGNKRDSVEGWFAAPLVGMVWPAYWLGRASIELTKPAAAIEVEKP